MRGIRLAGLLVLLAASPALAAASGALPFSLDFSPAPPPSPSVGSGAVTGRFGGVPVSGTYLGNTSSGSLTLDTESTTFADGTYTCDASGCSFTGTVAGKMATLGVAPGATATVTPTGVRVTGAVTSSAFPNHGAWVSAVSHWAGANLSGPGTGRVVSAAARGGKVRGVVSGDPRGVSRGHDPAAHGGVGRAGAAGQADGAGARGGDGGGQQAGGGSGGHGNDGGGRGNGGGGNGNGGGGGRGH